MIHLVHLLYDSVVNGKDYCFSAALASMLRHVTRYQYHHNFKLLSYMVPLSSYLYSNPDEQDQKRELEKVHDWFLANKPLLFSVSNVDL